MCNIVKTTPLIICTLLVLTLLVGPTLNAQLGQKIEAFPAGYFDGPVQKEQRYGREFLKLSKTKKDADLRFEYLFLNDEVVQVKIFVDNDQVSWDSLGEQFRKLQWGINFSDEKIEEVEKNDTLTAYFGENGGLLVIGKGKNGNAMFFESAKMRFVTDRWLRSQVGQEKQTDQTKPLKAANIKVGGRLKPIYNTDGTFKGYMSDKGIFFNQNMGYEGWIGK